MNNRCVGLDPRYRRFWAYRPGTLLGLDVHAALFSQILRHSLQMSSLERFSNILPVIMLYCARFDLVDITGWYSFSDDEGSTIDKERRICDGSYTHSPVPYLNLLPPFPTSGGQLSLRLHEICGLEGTEKKRRWVVAEAVKRRRGLEGKV